MSKTLYIHIGNYKTGTSSIQRFCHENSQSLKDSGLHYFESCRPERIKTNHGRLSLELIKKYGGHLPKWYTDDYNFESAINEIKKEVYANNDCSNFLISSEAFYRLESMKNGNEAIRFLKDSLADIDIDIKIIMYVREPLAFLTSWHNQVSKGASKPPSKTFIDYVNSAPQYQLDPNVNYNAWSAVFGESNMIVKEYQYKGQQHLQDFLEVIIQGFDNYPDADTAPVNTGVSSQQLADWRTSNLIKDYYAKRLNKKIGLNGYVNSEVLKDPDALRMLNKTLAFVYEKNCNFYARFFNKKPAAFDIFDVLAISANTNYIKIHKFWELNPSIDELVAKANSLKSNDSELALELFQIAKKSRPNGKYIQKNIDELT